MLEHATHDGRLLTIEEVSERLRLDKTSVYRKVDAGDIPAIRLASRGRGALRVREDELEEWLDSEVASS
jgi:excisionase family DNA binding protein